MPSRSNAENATYARNHRGPGGLPTVSAQGSESPPARSRRREIQLPQLKLGERRARVDTNPGTPGRSLCLNSLFPVIPCLSSLFLLFTHSQFSGSGSVTTTESHRLFNPAPAGGDSNPRSLLTVRPSVPTVIEGLQPAKSHENASLSEIDFSISWR
jgi:hypothetical protein